MKKQILVGLENGTIVRVDGYWGVLVKPEDEHRDGYRAVDFWPPKGREYVHARTVVEVMESRA